MVIGQKLSSCKNSGLTLQTENIADTFTEDHAIKRPLWAPWLSKVSHFPCVLFPIKWHWKSNDTCLEKLDSETSLKKHPPPQFLIMCVLSFSL